MKMIGMSGRSTATCFCRSRPLRPGREMSSTRQLGTRARGRARNSSADANVCGSQPSEWINNSSESRDDTSSSTTNTIGTACDIRDNPNLRPNACAPIILYLNQETARRIASVHPKRRVESLKQSGIAEWLEQARHGALCQNSRADNFIPQLIGIVSQADVATRSGAREKTAAMVEEISESSIPADYKGAMHR